MYFNFDIEKNEVSYSFKISDINGDFYELLPFEDYIFLSKPDGEGMGIKESKLFKLIDDYYRENF